MVVSFLFFTFFISSLHMDSRVEFPKDTNRKKFATTTTVNKHLDCPQYGYRLLGRKDSQFKTNVKSWTACSQHCRDTENCRHWVWYKWYSQWYCFTMTSYTSKYRITGAVAGDRDCEGNMVTHTLA